MNRLIFLVLAAALSLGLSGCASTKFYEVKQDGSDDEVGFLYYPPKPYLLVESKENNLTTRIISLPDLSRPHRVKQNSGWGASELGFEIENGMIKTFNSKSDSKGPETLTSIAGLASAQAALVTAESEIIAAKASAEGTGATIMFDGSSFPQPPITYVVKVFEDSFNKIDQKVIPSLLKAKNEFENEISTLNEIQIILKQNINIDYKPLEPDTLLNAVEEKRKFAKKLATQLKNVSSTLDVYENNEAEAPTLIMPAKNANTPLKQVITDVSKFSLRASSLTGLYEIMYIGGKLILRKVLLD